MNLSEVAFDPLFRLVPWVVFIPLIGLTLNLLLGKWLGEKGVALVACLAAAGAFGVAVALAFGLSRTPEGSIVPFADWITVGMFKVGWNFRVDTLSVLMMLVVSGVGTLIHIYAGGYMHTDVRLNEDPGRYRRFFVYFNLFILAMMILVSADNYLMLFVGWEGVGLCSYLLIGFWFEKGADGIGNAKAAKKAFVVNRIGDFGLLIALFLLFGAFGTLNFSEIFARAPQVAAAQPGVVLAIALFMLLGVAGKSAQLPLFVWLPDAMAGPTPVSALIHAATMVTAGVYLVARSMPIFSQVPMAQDVVMWVGAATALFAATIAVGQYDIKKVLAYSTISQLGFMVAAVGMGATVAGMFHLTTHAFFKALLFLSAGAVILGVEHGAEQAEGQDKAGHSHGHSLFDPQDMRNMGGLRKRMPVTFWVYLIGALALAGIPPLAGFFSKDEILAAAQGHNLGVFAVLAIAAFFTAFYMGRQVLMIFFGKGRTPAAEHASEQPAIITVPLIFLAVLSVLGGALNLPGVHTLESWLEHTLGHAEPAEFVLPVALLSVGLALVGIFLAWLLYGRKPLATPAQPDPLTKLGALYTGSERKWFVDELYQTIIVRPLKWLAAWFAGPVDQGGIDGVVNGAGSLTVGLAGLLRKLQTGYVRTYALWMVVGVAIMLAVLLLR